MSYQKRKLETEEGQQSHINPLKMLKHNNGITTIVNTETFAKDLNEGKYKFKLTEKTAKANLMKAANRSPIDIETKQTCKNIRFSAGAYFHVVLPVVRQWMTLFQTKQSLAVGGLNCTVDELEERNDLAAKHFNTKIVFCVNGGKVVIHCYNSTQNLRVDGKMHLEFIEHYLYPMFIKDIEKVKSDITEFDKMVISTLNPTQRQPVKTSRSVKTVRSIINQPHFICKHCEFTFNTYSQLQRHKITVHSKSFNGSQNSILPLTHSTRNNSFTDELLLGEDLSLNNVTEVDVQEKPETIVANNDQIVNVGSPEKNTQNHKNAI